MARKKVTRSLPLLPAVPSFGTRDNKTDQLLEILRTVAIENQKEHRQSFYSLRDIAAHFHIQLSTVSRIYRQLEQEGYLSRVRGSKTLLQGSNFDRHLSVRAFVGLPASLSAFVTQQDYRMFFIRLRRELRLRGFATEMILLESDEAQSAAFTDRLKAYEIDTVIWFLPSKEMKQTILRLADAGVRMVGISEDPAPHIHCRYQLRRETALRSLLNEWKTRAELAKITVVQSRQHRSPALEETLQTLLDQHGLRWSSATFSTQSTRAFLRSLLRGKRSAILFPSSSLVSMFSLRAPKAMTALMQTHRVGLISGPVNMPFARLPDVRVDLITFDWQVVAETIVDDLVTQEAFRDRGPVVFEAEPHVRVPLNRFAQHI